MPSRKLTRLLTTPLARPLVPAVEYRASAAAAYSPADEFTGGKNGWLFDGSAGKSAFLQSAGGSVAVNGDPLGSVEDLSGNGNDILQATGGAKPTNTVTGGINAISLASSKYMECTLASSMSVYRTCVYIAGRKTTGPAECYTLLMHGAGGTFDGSWVYNAQAVAADNNNVILTPSIPSGAATPLVFVYKKYDDAGTKKVDFSVYVLSTGALYLSGTAAAPSTAGVDDIKIGYPTPQLTCQIPFSMGIDGNLDTTNVLAYINTNFAGWAP